jgi:hypothetical protein
MGGGPSGSGDDTNVTNKDLSKAKANRDRKEMAQSGVQDPLDFTRLKENLQAKELEKRAEKGQINVPVPTIGTVVLNTIASMANRQQAKGLRGGGEMVSDSRGGYQGVVTQNTLGKVYSGNPDFDPNATKTPDNNEVILRKYASKKNRRSTKEGTGIILMPRNMKKSVL